MSDKELEEYINKIEPNFNSHLEKGTIEMSNEYYNLLEEKMVKLINKNQELKSQLKGTTHCFDEEEHEKLKKQLEELDKELFLAKNELGMRQKSIDNKLNQQKEFIKYLEDEIKLQEEINDIVLATGFEEILQKYKDIIGDDK